MLKADKDWYIYCYFKKSRTKASGKMPDIDSIFKSMFASV